MANKKTIYLIGGAAVVAALVYLLNKKEAGGTDTAPESYTKDKAAPTDSGNNLPAGGSGGMVVTTDGANSNSVEVKNAAKAVREYKKRLKASGANEGNLAGIY